MSRLPQLPESEVPEAAKPLFDFAEQMMGFTPNDARDMARNPALLKATAELFGVIYGTGTVDPGLKRLIGYITSTAAGCKYCQMHTAHGAHTQGVDAQKIAKAWEYKTSDLFNAAERAALRVAQGGGVSSSQVTDEQFADLRLHFTDDECIEIVSVIAMFGFLNRWNSVMGTDIEGKPETFAGTIDLELK